MIATATARDPQQPNGSSPALQACLAFLVFYVVGAGAVTLLAPAAGDAAVAAARRIELSGLGMLVGLAALLLFARYSPPQLTGWRRGVLPQTAGLYLLFLLVWVPLTFVAYPWFVELIGGKVEPQSQLAYFTGQPATPWGFWVMVLVACVGAPLGEEILFRGYVQEACRRVLPVWAAVALTAVAFGFLHGPLYALPIGLLGALFGFLRERFDCLEAPVFAHALHNSLTLAFTCTFPETIGS